MKLGILIAIVVVLAIAAISIFSQYNVVSTTTTTINSSTIPTTTFVSTVNSSSAPHHFQVIANITLNPILPTSYDMYVNYAVYSPLNHYVYFITNAGLSALPPLPSVNSTIGINASATDAVYDPDNDYVYAVNFGSKGTVSVISGTKIVAEINVAPYPESVVYNPQNHYMYVASLGNYFGQNTTTPVISVISGTSIIANITGVYGLQSQTGVVASLLYNPANSYMYGLNTNHTVAVISGTSVIANIIFTNNSSTYPNVAVVDSSNGYIYLASEGLNGGVVNIISGTRIIANFSLNWWAPGSSIIQRIIYDSFNNYIYVLSNYTTISVFSGEKFVKNLNMGEMWGLASGYDPSRGYLYVENYAKNGDNLSIISGTNIIKNISTGRIEGIVYDPSDNNIYVLRSEMFSGNESVSILLGTETIANVTVSSHSVGIYCNPFNGDIYVPNFMSHTISIISSI